MEVNHLNYTRPEFWINASIVLLLVLLCVLVYLFNPAFFFKLWSVATSGNMEETVNYIASFGIWAIVFSFFLDVLINALGFLPSIFISTANGVLFGIVPGVIVSWLAETTGVIISFLLMRGILRASAEKMIAKSGYLQKLDEFSGKNGFKMMLVARTLPYFPSGIITAIGALSSISLRDYALANLIGKFPSTALEVIIGYDLVNYEKNMDRLAIVVTVSAVVYFAIWKYKNKKSDSF